MSNDLMVQPTAALWLTQTCSADGCTVTIRGSIDHQEDRPLCKWCKSQTAYNTRDAMPIVNHEGPPISLDEFGQDLFAAIKAQAGAIQALKSAGLYQAKGLPHQADQAARAATVCQRELETIFRRNTIAVYDVRRILAMQ